MSPDANFSGLVQAFFTDRLLRQRRVSPHTVAGYRDTFRLLLRFAKQRLGNAPSKLSLKDLDASFVGDFLDHLEKDRRNGARSRNTRLAAIHSFFQYVSFQEPAHAEQCRRVLAIPSKRYERRLIEYLSEEEIDALVAAPDKTTWRGRRDHGLLLVAIQTGLREKTPPSRSLILPTATLPFARVWLPSSAAVRLRIRKHLLMKHSFASCANFWGIFRSATLWSNTASG